MNLELVGKKALVTGGCKGIGKAIVEALKDEGCEVYSVCRCSGYDLTLESSIAKIIETYHDIDILINNVGGGGTWRDDDWAGVLDKNIFPMVSLTPEIVRAMASRGWGRVITISSIYGREAGGTPAFSMAKSAQIAYMKSFASSKEMQGFNITFNTICPGPIKVKGKEMVYDRYGEPEDVANLVVFLCSDKARWVNGACISVDGGMSKVF